MNDRDILRHRISRHCFSLGSKLEEEGELQGIAAVLLALAAAIEFDREDELGLMVLPFALDVFANAEDSLPDVSIN